MGIRDIARYCIENVFELVNISLQICLVMYDAVTYARAVSASDVEMHLRERVGAAESTVSEKRLMTPVEGAEPVVLRRTLYSKCSYTVFSCKDIWKLAVFVM